MFTPDEVLDGAELHGPVVIYDIDHYYMGSCLAELLRARDLDVTLVTTANAVSAWTFMNNEMADIRQRMIELGVNIILESAVAEFCDGMVRLRSIYSGGPSRDVECASLVVAGKKLANDSLFTELKDADLGNLHRIGDCSVPGAIAHAVYSGHECARSIDGAEGSFDIAWERPELTTS